MRHVLTAALVASTILVAGCAATSSSTPAGNQQTAAWTGKVLVTDARLPETTRYKVMGTVEADARSGYESVTALYPMLADEARKLGANAVIGVDASRRITWTSWSAGRAKGTAVRVDDEAALKKLQGTYH